MPGKCPVPALKLKFQIQLTRRPIPESIRETGPLFHRWLPDGKNDAIALTSIDEQEQLIVWFERQTVVDHGFLSWERNGTAFDPNIMQRQGKIDAGPLFGEMNAVVSNTEVVAIEKFPIKVGEPFGLHDPASQEYIAAGKRITGKIQQRVGKLVSRLRTQYGQYWLEELLPWDSRRMSLGSYCCSVLNLRWLNGTDSSWCRFLPTPGQVIVSSPRMPGRGYAEYLTEADWRRLQLHRCQSDVGLGVELLGAVTEALDTGNWSYAFITVVTALEFALAARVQGGKDHPKVRSALNSFDDHETLPARAAVVLLACEVPADHVATVLSAIQMRNKIAHDGYRPNEQDAFELWSVMQTIRSLMQVDELKTPILTNSNSLAAS
jgi:hypothetical protein